MKRVLFSLLLVATGCAPVTSDQSSPSPRASETATPTAQTEAPLPTPAATAAPMAEMPQPEVSVAAGSFGIQTTLRLKMAVVDDAVVQAARQGVQSYLQGIDMYRAGTSPVLPITGPFRDAVATALTASATPGVTRQFVLLSLRVDRHLQKPWGTHAYADVTVTIADRAIDGKSPDQIETGQLRLTGDRMRVTDAWDADHGRWFNGFGPLPLDQIRTEMGNPIAEYLRAESWAPLRAPRQWASGGSDGAFVQARAKRVATIDRTQTVSRIFENTIATIERFETIEGVWSGLATVRLNGTLATVNAAGGTTRTSFERRVQVFLFGSWAPEVVDEQGSDGAWVSGGLLALEKVDIDRA
ncbi:MAG: hypothetical protein M3R54_03335 [Chloroflexota bacterium]|nr:hypothetical protein [Chloroflexota bacterium]